MMPIPPDEKGTHYRAYVANELAMMTMPKRQLMLMYLGATTPVAPHEWRFREAGGNLMAPESLVFPGRPSYELKTLYGEAKMKKEAYQMAAHFVVEAMRRDNSQADVTMFRSLAFFQFMSAGFFQPLHNMAHLPSPAEPLSPWHFLCTVRPDMETPQAGMIPRAGLTATDLHSALETIILVFHLMTDFLPTAVPPDAHFSFFRHCSILGGMLALAQEHVLHANFSSAWAQQPDAVRQQLTAHFWNHICGLFAIFHRWQTNRSARFFPVSDPQHRTVEVTVISTHLSTGTHTTTRLHDLLDDWRKQFEVEFHPQRLAVELHNRSWRPPPALFEA